MWKRRRKLGNQENLSIFLEAIENDEDKEDVVSTNVSDAAIATNDVVNDAEDESKETKLESFAIGDNPEDQKQIQEAQFVAKDYNVVVDVIVNAADKIAQDLGVETKIGKIKEILASEFSDVFKADNPTFDADRFVNSISGE